MEIIKRIIAVFVSLCLAAGSITWMNATEKIQAETLRTDEFEYVVLDDGTAVEITKYTGGKAEVEIPSVIEGKHVSSIGTRAFEQCTFITKVSIPEGVYRIGANAFIQCTNLQQVDLPESLREIWDYAFNICTALKKISIPDGVKEIGSGAFFRCSSLKEIVIPGGITEIKDTIFCGCNNLERIEIPDGIVSIGASAFADCGNLLKISIPEEVVSIGNSAFSGCSKLEEITIPDAVTSIGAIAFKDCEKITKIIIPNSVDDIGIRAFLDCTGLKDVTISSSLSSLEEGLFIGCTGLEKIRIPESVESIADNVFKDCSNLTDVYYSGMEQDWSTVSIAAGNEPLSYVFIHFLDGTTLNCSEQFYECQPMSGGKVEVTSYTGTSAAVHIPSQIKGETVGGISSIAFDNNKNLKKVIIPAGVTVIGEGIFSNCTELTTIEVETGNTDYFADDGVLFHKGRNSLIRYPEGKTGEYSVPSDVVSLDTLCFQNCVNLTSIKIPESVVQIKGGAFYNCSALKNVYYSGSEIQWKKVDIDKVGMMGDVNSNAPLTEADIHFAKEPELEDEAKDFVYNELADGTMEITGYTGSGPSVEIPSEILGKTVTGIGGYAFSSLWQVSEIILPSSVTTIKPYAFWNSGIVRMEIPEGVTNIGQNAFMNCQKLTGIEVNADNNAYASDSGVLYNKEKTSLLSCPGGKTGSYIIPSGVKDIGDNAFYKCSSLTEVSIPEGVVNIQLGAFSGCRGITEIELPNTIINIGAEAFSSCQGLKKISLPSRLNDIGRSAFSGCTNLAEITIPYGLENIGAGVFQGCGSLKKAVIPSSVTTIEKEAFYNCGMLDSVTLPNSVVLIQERAFGKCGSLRDVYYSGNRVEWDKINISTEDDGAGSNEPLLSAVIHFRNGTTLNGPENDADFAAGIIAAYDQTEKTVRISGQTFETADKFNFDSIHDIYQAKEQVVASIQNGRIVKIECVKDIVKFCISISENSKPPITLQNNGWLQDYQNILVVVEARSDYPQSAFSGLEDVKLYVNEINVSVEHEGFCISHLNAERTGEHTLTDIIDKELPLGGTISKEYSIYVKDGYLFSEEELPYAVTAKVQGKDGAVEISQKTLYAYCEKIEETSNLDNAKKELADLTAADSLFLEKDLLNYFSQQQIDVIERYIYTWLAEINYAYRYQGKSSIKRYLMNKAGLDADGDFISGGERAVTHIVADTPYGKKILEIALDIGKPDKSGNLYLSFGNMSYEILEKNGIPESLPKKGQIGKSSYKDMADFIDYVESADNDMLQNTYQWKNLSDEMTAGVLIDKTVIDIIGEQNGSFSDNVYTVYLKPVYMYSKKVTIACPVDVYIRHMDGTLAGAIVDNKLKLKEKNSRVDENVKMEVNGSSKTVYLTNDDYYINLQGTDNGTMDYTVEEIADNETKRKIEFLQMQLQKDLEYYGYVFKPLNIDSNLYALKKSDEADTVVYSNADTYQYIFKKVKGLSLSQLNTSLYANNSVQLNASLFPADASNQNLKWTSDNETVVSVGSNGLVTALGTGSAIVTVSTQDGTNLKASCMIVVGKETDKNENSKPQGPGSGTGTGAGTGTSQIPVAPSAPTIPSAPEELKPPEPMVVYYIVKFDANAGMNLSRKTMTLLNDDSLGILPKVQREYYNFIGWFTQQFGGKHVTSDTVLNEAVTLYAQWEKVEEPEKPKAIKLKSPKKGQMKVQFKKVDGAEGYEITYSVNKKFAKAAKVVDTAFTLKTIKKLKKGKLYYVKARAYKLDSSGKKIYGVYSAVKKVKIRK